ncbi:MAG: response regulator [Spirochaetia bacterium]|nr:response regulator [Spirochaetia bacterium]
MNNIRILFVDDEMAILDSLKRSLRKLPYELVFINKAMEVLTLMEKEEFHILISDHKMPEMTGTVLLAQVKNRFPGVIRILMSGFADMSIMVEAINQGEVFRFIPKPWKKGELERIISEAVNKYTGENPLIRGN